MILRLHSLVNKEIRKLLDEATGNIKLKRKVFEQFKQLGHLRKESTKVLICAKKHMKKWKLCIYFKSWQNVKKYENALNDRELKIVELMNKRK